MKRLAILFVLTILTVNFLTTDSRSAIDAQRFVSLEGRFSISLPHRSDFKRVTIHTPFGNAPGREHQWKTNEGTFGVGYGDSHQPIEDPELIKTFFDAATEHYKIRVEQNGGTIASVKKISLDKYPGIEQRADLSGSSVIRRMFLVSRRIYETSVVLHDSQRNHEDAAVRVLHSFKVLSDREITEAALKAAPGPLPQTPEARRAGSDADEEGLSGPVKSARTEIQYVSENPLMRGETRSWVITFNEKGNYLRSEFYDFKGNLSQITVYGHLDGARVSASKYIERDYGIPSGIGSGIGGFVPSSRKSDPRYDQKYEFKYDDKKRLIEQTDFLSNGDLMSRRVYTYEGNQKEELNYSGSSLSRRTLYILDDKGNVIERTDFGPDGSFRLKIFYTYEFDSKGSWTKRTTFAKMRGDKPEPRSVLLRTITYY